MNVQSLTNMKKVDQEFFFKWSNVIFKTGIAPLEYMSYLGKKHTPNGNVILHNVDPKLGIEFVCNNYHNSLTLPAIEWARKRNPDNPADDWDKFHAYFLIKEKGHLETQVPCGILFNGYCELLNRDFLNSWDKLNSYKLHYARVSLQ